MAAEQSSPSGSQPDSQPPQDESDPEAVVAISTVDRTRAKPAERLQVNARKLQLDRDVPSLIFLTFEKQKADSNG